MRPGLSTSRTVGAWLSLLALYVQVLLPMIVAAEMRVADAGGVPAFVLCSSGHVSSDASGGGAAGTPAGQDGHSRRCCPLCGALGTPYIAPAEAFISVPVAWSSVAPQATDVVVVAPPTAPLYEARAPPLNG